MTGDPGGIARSGFCAVDYGACCAAASAVFAQVIRASGGADTSAMIGCRAAIVLGKYGGPC